MLSTRIHFFPFVWLHRRVWDAIYREISFILDAGYKHGILRYLSPHHNFMRVRIPHSFVIKNHLMVQKYDWIWWSTDVTLAIGYGKITNTTTLDRIWLIIVLSSYPIFVPNTTYLHVKTWLDSKNPPAWFDDAQKVASPSGFPLTCAPSAARAYFQISYYGRLEQRPEQHRRLACTAFAEQR